MAEPNFQHQYYSLQSHDPSEIILISWSSSISYDYQFWKQLCCL